MATVIVSPPNLCITQNGVTGNFSVTISASPGSTTVVTLAATTLGGGSPGGTFSGGSANADTVGLSFTTVNFGTPQTTTYTPPTNFIGHICIIVTNSTGQTNPANGISTNPLALIVVSGTGTYTPVPPLAKGPGDASRTSTVKVWCDADNFPIGSIGGYVIGAGGSGNVAPTCTIPAPIGGGTTATATPVVAGGAIIGLTPGNPGKGYGPADDPIHVTFVGASGSPSATAVRGNPPDQSPVGAFISAVGATPSQFLQATAAKQPVYCQNGGPSGAAALMWTVTTQTMECALADAVLSGILVAGSSYSITMVVKLGTGEAATNALLFSQAVTFTNSAGNLAGNTGFRRYSDGPIYNQGISAQAASPAASNTVFLGELWYPITLTYNTSTGTETLYVNGQVAATMFGGASRESWGSATGYWLGASGFIGAIAQVVIDDVALTQTQVEEDAAYWRSRYVNSSTPALLVAVGDSRTECRQSNLPSNTIFPWINQVQALIGPIFSNIAKIVNDGIGGSTADSIGYSWKYQNAPAGSAASGVNSPDTTHYAALALPLYKLCVVIFYGFNSFTQSGSGTDPTAPGAGWASLYDLVTKYLDHGATVVLCTEIDENFGRNANYNTWRTNYDALILANFGNSSTLLVARLDQTILGTVGTSANPVYFGPDGVHPLGERPQIGPGPQGGYQFIAQAVAPLVLQAVATITSASSQPNSRITSNNQGGGL